MFPIFRPPQQKILPNILSTIGRTPMVRLNKIPKSCGVSCEMRKLFETLMDIFVIQQKLNVFFTCSCEM